MATDRKEHVINGQRYVWILDAKRIRGGYWKKVEK